MPREIFHSLRNAKRIAAKIKVVTTVAFVAFSTGSFLFPILIIWFETGISPSSSELGPLMLNRILFSNRSWYLKATLLLDQVLLTIEGRSYGYITWVYIFRLKDLLAQLIGALLVSVYVSLLAASFKERRGSACSLGLRKRLGKQEASGFAVTLGTALTTILWSGVWIGCPGCGGAVVTVALVLLGFSVGLLVFPFLYALGLLLTFVGILYMGRKVPPIKDY